MKAGFYGTEVITDTAAHTGLFGCLVALEDSQISALVAAGFLSGNAIAAETLPKGLELFLPGITSLTLTSGAVLARRMPPSFLTR